MGSVKEESYGFGMKVLNGIIGATGRLGIIPLGLDMDSAAERARKRTGLQDLGTDIHEAAIAQIMRAPELRELSHFGRFALNGMAVDAFENRLRLTEYLKRNPEVEDIKIERPIFIVGFPRTGTTLLQNLLNLADDRRGIPMWEMTNPIPIVDAGINEAEKRQHKAKSRLAVANLAASEMKYIHDVKFDSLEECWPLMINQFMALHWDITCRWPSYGDWFIKQDVVPTYREYKKFLQVMAHRVPDKKFILKCPDHMWCLEALFDVYPDACVIWAHRDPGKSIPSYCSLVSLSWRFLYGKFKPAEMGNYIAERFIRGIDRGMASREKLGEDRIYDVNFQSLVDDPVGVVNSVTSYFDMPVVPQQKLTKYLKTDRPDNHGKHKYTAEYFGLDNDAIRDQCSEYIDRFNLTVGL